jgi:hypothetical protein
MVWVIAKTTAVLGPPESLRSRAAVSRGKDVVKPAAHEPGVPVSGQPSSAPRSSTA